MKKKLNNYQIVRFLPSIGSHNPYIDMIIRSCENSKLFRLDKRRFKEVLLRPRQHLVADVTFLNWHENKLINNEGKITFLMILKYFSMLLVFRLTTKKLNRINHNKYPHNMDIRYDNTYKKIIWLSKYFINTEYNLIGTDGQKLFPHPAFNLNRIDKSAGEMFLTFGSLQRYRGIKEILNTWEENYPQLLICGHPTDKIYVNELLEKCAYKDNIHLRAEFVSEDEIDNIMNNYKSIIINMMHSQALVSSAIIFALSKGIRPIVLCDEDRDFGLLNKYVYATNLDDLKNVLSEKTFNLTDSEYNEFLRIHSKSAIQEKVYDAIKK